MLNNVIPKVAILHSKLTVLIYDIYISTTSCKIVDVVKILIFTPAEHFNTVYISSPGKIKETFLSRKRSVWCILFC